MHHSKLSKKQNPGSEETQVDNCGDIKMKKIVGIIISVILAGCGGLQVHVSVLDPQIVEKYINEDLLQDKLPSLLAEKPEHVETQIGLLRRAHFEYYAKISDLFLEKAKTLPDSDETKKLIEDEAAAIQDDFNDRVAPKYADAIGEIQKLDKEIQALHHQAEKLAEGAEKSALNNRIIFKIKQRNLVLENFLSYVSTDMDKEKADAITKVLDRQFDDNVEASSNLMASEKKIDIIKNSIVMGQVITESPYAHVVASAPESAWVEKFNRVYGRGYLGNVNFAIKMESVADFTIKGLTFDPGDVAVAASKVTTQAVLLAAQIAGVPVNLDGSSPSESGAALSMSSKRLTEIRKKLASQKAMLKGYHDALNTIANAILREKKYLSEDDTKRAEAIEAIQRVYEAQKSRIEIRESF